MNLIVVNSNSARQPLPAWAVFLIECGWSLGMHPQEQGKRITVLSLPSRITASAFCALGVLKASAATLLPPLTFSEFLELKSGSHVISVEHISGQDKTQEWTVVPAGARGERKLKHGNCTMPVYRDTFGRLELFTGAVAKPKKQARLIEVARFYRRLVPASGKLWTHLARTECLIVTNRANWKREIEELRVCDSSSNGASGSTELRRVLMTDDDPQADFVRVLLASPGDSLPDLDPDIPVILDGPEAFRTHSLLNAKRILVLLECKEYDEAIDQELLELFCTRDDSLLASEGQPAGLPTRACDFTEFVLAEEDL